MFRSSSSNQSYTFAVDVHHRCTPFDMIPVLVSRFKREHWSVCLPFFSHHNRMLNLDYRSDPQRTVIEVESVFATRLRPDCPLSQRIEQTTAGICVYFSSHTPQTAHCTYYSYCDRAVAPFPSGIQITYPRL